MEFRFSDTTASGIPIPWNPGLWVELQTCSYVILHFWLVANPMKLNENWRQEQRRVRFEDRIHLTQMLYMLKWPTDPQGQWLGQTSDNGMWVWEPAVGGREVTVSHSLPIFVRLSSLLPEWSCLILLQFCNNTGLPLLLLGRQNFFPSRQCWRKRYLQEIPFRLNMP